MVLASCAGAEQLVQFKKIQPPSFNQFFMVFSRTVKVKPNFEMRDLHNLNGDTIQLDESGLQGLSSCTPIYSPSCEQSSSIAGHVSRYNDKIFEVSVWGPFGSIIFPRICNDRKHINKH